MKAANILLNARLEAKIADFGLTKAFNCENDTHISTNTLVGTPGYVDPEYVNLLFFIILFFYLSESSRNHTNTCRYQTTMQLTIKSDVYSFGVVLLELITGRPAILRGPEPTSIMQWAQQQLARGNIEGVLDPHMQGELDVNSVWKATDIALKCTAQASSHRPTMTDVVLQLSECLELEDAHANNGDANDSFYTGDTNDQHSRYNAYTADSHFTDGSDHRSIAFEVEHNFGRVPTISTGPDVR